MSPSISARATMPCLNSSGNVASEASSTPSARRPFQVNATVTQRLSFSTEARTSAADCTVSRIAASQARPPAALRNDRNSYRRGDRGHAGKQNMLDVVELEHNISPQASRQLVEHDDALVHQGRGFISLKRPSPYSAGRYCLPFAQAHAAMRHPSASLRSATVNIAPICVTCLPWTLNVMVAGTTTYALSPVTLLCNGSPRVTR